MQEFTCEHSILATERPETPFARTTYQEHLARYRFAARFVHRRDVLHLGCGIGDGSLCLAKHGASHVSAIDRSAEAIRYACAHHSHPAIQFGQTELQNLDPGRKFDVIVCFDVIEHVDDPTSALRCIRDYLAPTGFLVMSLPRFRASTSSTFEPKEGAFQSFCDLLQSHFPHLQLFFDELPQSEDRACRTLQERRALYRFSGADALGTAPSEQVVCVASSQPLSPIQGAVVLGNGACLSQLEAHVVKLHRIQSDLRGNEARRREAVVGPRWHEWIRELLLPAGSRRRRGARLALRIVLKARNPRAFCRTVYRRLSRALPFLKPRSRYPLHFPGQVTPAGSIRKVTFLVGCQQGESKRYRVFNFIEGLTRRGITCAAIDEKLRNPEPFLDSDVLVVFRLRLTAQASYLIKRFRQASVSVIFDIDDLILETGSAQNMDYEGVQQYRAALHTCNAATCTTPLLQERIQSLGIPACVVPNTINSAQVKRAERLVGKRRESGDSVRVGYFSGTLTHKQDFLAAAPALEQIMDEYRNVALHVVGPHVLPPTFQRFGSRVVRAPLMPYLAMLNYLAAIDINIAPLELDNPFTGCKSELKIFEAALVGCPTIASAVDSYSRIVEHGHNGFLARSTEDWKQALASLIESASLRQRIGEQAKADFSARFSVDANMDTLIRSYEELRQEAYAPALVDVRSMDIAWIIPRPVRDSMVHRTIYRAAQYLAAFGHRLTLYHPGSGSRDHLKRYVRRWFCDLDSAHFAWLEEGLVPHDICIATDSSSLSALCDYRDIVRFPFCLSQDVAALLRSTVSTSILAERAKGPEITYITPGPTSAAVLRQRYGADADYCRFPIERDIYTRGPRTKSNPNIVCFIDPNAPRRRYELAMAMLAQVKKRLPQAELILFGSEGAADLVPFEHTNLGQARESAELVFLYRNADLAIVISGENAGATAFEMMACGTAVCTLKMDHAALDYGSEENVFLLDGDPTHMAEQAATILADENERTLRSRNGWRFVQEFPDEQAVAGRIEQLVVRRVIVGRTEQHAVKLAAGA